MTCYDFLFEPI